MKQEQVKDWMTRDVLSVTPDTTLPEVHHLMTSKHIRHLPVLEHDRLVGVVSLGDLRAAESSDAAALNKAELGYLLNRLKIQAVMNCHPITIRPEATIDEAARVMLEKKIAGLPVIDERGHVVGILTESDILRLVAQVWPKN